MGEVLGEEAVEKQLPLKAVKRNRPKERWTVLLVLVLMVAISLFFYLFSGQREDSSSENSWWRSATFEF